MKYLDLTGLSHLWDKIKAKFTVYYGTCSTSASTQVKAVTCADFTLVEGARIDVKFTNAQSYNASADTPVQLNINSTGAKAVMSNGTTFLPRYAWKAGEIVRFVYDGTNYIAVNNALATTTYYGRTKLSSSVSSTSTSVSATPSAVKQAYDLAEQADTQATTNAGNIATNTSDIATNTGNIATNTSNIATNTGKIATNTNRIVTIESYVADTGWTAVTPSVGSETIKVRKIGKTVNLYVFGDYGVSLANNSTTTFATIPDGYRPSSNIIAPCVLRNASGTEVAEVSFYVNSDGSLRVRQKTGSAFVPQQIFACVTYFIG